MSQGQTQSLTLHSKLGKNTPVTEPIQPSHRLTKSLLVKN